MNMITLCSSVTCQPVFSFSSRFPTACQLAQTGSDTLSLADEIADPPESMWDEGKAAAPREALADKLTLPSAFTCACYRCGLSSHILHWELQEGGGSISIGCLSSEHLALGFEQSKCRNTYFF